MEDEVEQTPQLKSKKQPRNEEIELKLNSKLNNFVEHQQRLDDILAFWFRPGEDYESLL